MRIPVVLAILILLLPLASACKDIVVMNSATSEDCNLFMKVRDPSRPGIQVLFMVDRGYEYTYPHPQKHYEASYEIQHKLLGVATIGDVPPDIIKAGMLLSDADIAYGDADSPTFWVNPTKRAWDDFDWLRYAAQTANNEDEAVDKLEEVVAMHAPGVGENLFVVGKNKAYVIEADAFHFVKEGVGDFAVMSNYPKELWHTRWLKKTIIASNFDRVYEGAVKRWQTVRLGALSGIKVTKIGNEWIVAKPVPVGEKVEIDKGKGAKVGDFYVHVDEITGNSARIKVYYEYNAWEQKITDRLKEKYGRITVTDLMNLSRLHSGDLEGLRGMCEGEKKATMIFRIPCHDGVSMGWFAPDQCASIFVPVHICDTEIYEAYTSGEAADIAISLLMKFGHGKLNVTTMERVLVKENERMEDIALGRMSQAADILTLVDVEMQKQAILMQKLYLNVEGEELEELNHIWSIDYYETVCNIEHNISRFGDYGQEQLAAMALSMGRARAGVKSMVNGSNALKDYNRAEALISEGHYREGITVIKHIFEDTDRSLFGVTHEKEQDLSEWAILLGSAMVIMAIIGVLFWRSKR